MFSFFKKKKKEIEAKEQKREFVFNTHEAKTLLDDIKSRFGLDYSKQERITLSKIESFAKTKGFYSFLELYEQMQRNSLLQEELINLLTVNETYFCREKHQIERLIEFVQKQQLHSILSAPCATGEEVYTILIKLHEAELKDVKVSGIDINSDAIAKAKEAIYSKRSISKVPPMLLSRYFTQKEDSFEVVHEIKQKANFYVHNIFDENIASLGRYDIVFSRNMLIYFENSDKKRAIKQFYNLLKPRGYLFLGHADIAFLPDGFTKVDPLLQIFQKN